MIKVNEKKRREFLAEQARNKRDALLSDCDGKMVVDAPFDKSAWSTYRQTLRDITEQAGFPDVIVWPEAPQ